MRTTTMQEIREIAAVHGIGDLPVVTVDSVRVEPLSGNLRQVDVTFRNERVLPSRSAHEVSNKITHPD